MRWTAQTSTALEGSVICTVRSHTNTADPPYRHFVSEVSVTAEAFPAVNSHVNRHYCQSKAYNSHTNCSGRARRLTFDFLRQTPLRATSVPTWYNSFLSHKLKTLKGEIKEKKVYLFSNREKAPPISAATFDMS